MATLADQLTRIENGIKALLRVGYRFDVIDSSLTEEEQDAELADDIKWREEWIEKILNGEIQD